MMADLNSPSLLTQAPDPKLLKSCLCLPIIKKKNAKGKDK
jgi:hypothetical protein